MLPKSKYGLDEYRFEIGPIDDTGETVAIVGIEYSSVSDSEVFYRQSDVDALLAEKDSAIGELRRQLRIRADGGTDMGGGV